MQMAAVMPMNIYVFEVRLRWEAPVGMKASLGLGGLVCSSGVAAALEYGFRGMGIAIYLALWLQRFFSVSVSSITGTGTGIR